MNLRSFSRRVTAPLLVTLALMGSPPDAQGRAMPGRLQQSVIWTEGSAGGTWQESVAQAAAHEEGVFTDWRLPTLEELKAAVTDADPATFGRYDPNVTVWVWSSKSQGQFAHVVKIVTDVNGYPIPSLSGASKKEPKNGLHPAKFVRP